MRATWTARHRSRSSPARRLPGTGRHGRRRPRDQKGPPPGSRGTVPPEPARSRRATRPLVRATSSRPRCWFRSVRVGKGPRHSRCREEGAPRHERDDLPDLPLADRDRKWDGDAADARIRKWAEAEEKPTPDYRDAHVWYDGDAADNFGSYKLLIADVVDGRLEAVPHAIIAAGNVIQGARGGIDLPRDDIQRVKNHLARYYEKMGDNAPWEEAR